QLSLFARYYKTIGQSRFAIFGQADAGYGFGKISYENKNVNGGTTVTVDSESKQTSLNFGVSPGITFFVTDRLALEATAGRISYSITNTVAYDSAGDKAGESKNSALSLAVNPNSFSFGLT